MQQNMLFLIIFDFSILNNTFFIFITFFWKHILGLLSLDIFELVRVQSLKRSMKLTGSQLKLSRNIPSLMHFRSNPSMLGHKLARGAHTVRILDSIEYFLGRRPITLSRWIFTLTIPPVHSTSTWSSCSFPIMNAGVGYDETWDFPVG